jgi:hypothetical protein
LARRREAKARTLVAEVAADADGACVVAVKLPNGTRRERAFSSSHAVSDVFDFVDTLEEVDGMEYSLVSNYPRRVFQRATAGYTRARCSCIGATTDGRRPTTTTTTRGRVCNVILSVATRN